MTTKPDEYDPIQSGYWLGQFEKMRHERDELRADNKRLKARLIDLTNEGWYSQRQRLEAEVERLRKIERAARAAVETEKALGYVRLTLLADVLDES